MDTQRYGSQNPSPFPSATCKGFSGALDVSYHKGEVLKQNLLLFSTPRSFCVLMFLGNGAAYTQTLAWKSAKKSGQINVHYIAFFNQVNVVNIFCVFFFLVANYKSLIMYCCVLSTYLLFIYYLNIKFNINIWKKSPYLKSQVFFKTISCWFPKLIIFVLITFLHVNVYIETMRVINNLNAINSIPYCFLPSVLP